MTVRTNSATIFAMLKSLLDCLHRASLKSSYVLMELGAGWGLKSRVVPLLSPNVEFGAIPGPIGQGIHAIKASDADGVAGLIDSIAARCSMAWRAPKERQHALVAEFAASAAGSSSNPPVERDDATVARQQPGSTHIADMAEEERVGRLRLWLHDHTEDPRANGRPFQLTEIDQEMSLPAGSAEKYIDRALDGNWEVIRRHGSFIELSYSPRIRDVEHPRRFP